MKKVILGVVLCLGLAGCGSFTESRGVPLLNPVKTVAIGEFTASDPAIGKLFAQTVEDEFAKAGYTIVSQTANPDLILSGIAVHRPYEREINWSLVAKNREGQKTASVRFETPGVSRFDGPQKSSEIAIEISRRFLKQINAR